MSKKSDREDLARFESESPAVSSDPAVGSVFKSVGSETDTERLAREKKESERRTEAQSKELLDRRESTSAEQPIPDAHLDPHIEREARKAEITPMGHDPEVEAEVIDSSLLKRVADPERPEIEDVEANRKNGTNVPSDDDCRSPNVVWPGCPEPESKDKGTVRDRFVSSLSRK